MQRDRLDFIDGLRGFAALIVAVGHTIGMVGPDHPDLPLWASDFEHFLLWPWLFGEQMVWLFIMLSGFALYWSEENRIIYRGTGTSLATYAKRRLWRILPTYYLSLGLGLVVVVGLGWFLLEPSPSLRSYDPVTTGGVISHLFLLHNFSAAWIHQVNPPLWSIAVEMQLYLLFPLLFVLRKRISVYGAAAALIMSVTLAGMFLPSRAFALVEWFILGAVLAHICRRWEFKPTPWLVAAALATGVGLLRIPQVEGRVELLVWLTAFGALVVGLFSAYPGRWNLPTTAYAKWLGDRSYSLYAVHFPIVLLAWALIGRLDLPRAASLTLVLLLGVGLSILTAHLAYRLVERPSTIRSRSVGRPQRKGSSDQKLSSTRARPSTKQAQND